MCVAQIITVFHNDDAIVIEDHFHNFYIVRNLGEIRFINYLFKYDTKGEKIVHY